MAQLALERNAENVQIMDMTRVSGLCDYFVLCSASSKTRGRTIAEHIQDEMKKIGNPIIHRDGLKECDWIVLDFSDIVVHIFLADLRKYYDLESLWGDAPRRSIAEEVPVKAARPVAAKPVAVKPAKSSKTGRSSKK